jgi:hypothetical protein
VPLPTDAGGGEAAGQVLARVLDDYAGRAMLRSLSIRRGRGAALQCSFRWFRDRELAIELGARGAHLRLHGALEHVPPRSPLDRALRDWLRSRQAQSVAEHRRLDPARVRLMLRNQDGAISVCLQSLDGDMEYATRKLIHLLNELYLDFLANQAPFDWLVQSFGLDPDNPVWP